MSRLWLQWSTNYYQPADKLTYNGGICRGDLGASYTYEEFVDLFEVDIVQVSKQLLYKIWWKSSNYTIIDLSATADKTITATSDAEDFRMR